jgi:vitamin B12 transporter
MDREIISSFPTRYEAKSYTADTYATYQFSTSMSALIGLQYADAAFSSFTVPFGGSDFETQLDAETANHQSIDPYLNIAYTSTFGLAIAGGARLNNHSEYGAHTVYNVNPSYRFDFETSALKVLGSYSTAYITPSLFQLHDPFYGNLELQPEENTTIEGGLEYTNQYGFRASAIYFQRTEKNYVDFVTVDPDLFIFQYQNVPSEFMASGVEVEVAKNFGSKFIILANYTNTKPDAEFALRIPEHKANLRLTYNLKEKTNIGLSYQFVGERKDSFFNPETFESENVALDGYNLLGLSATNQISQNITIFGAISNVLNSEYEELYRYQTTGRNFRLGLQLNF